MSSNPNDALIVALDFPTVDEAWAMVEKLGPACQFYKIGLELLFHGGQRLAQKLKAQGKRVFIDAKLLDIATTVEKATRNIAKLEADFLTVHVTDRQTLEAAVRGRGDSSLRLLGVTVMTSLSEHDLAEQGIANFQVQDLVSRRAELAEQSGLDGVVASGLEASTIRANVGRDFLIVTPGIRPLGADAQDQNRVMTPSRAIAAGAQHLVVGRPICQADDPREVAEAINAEIAQALAPASTDNL